MSNDKNYCTPENPHPDDVIRCLVCPGRPVCTGNALRRTMEKIKNSKRREEHV